VVKLVYVSGSAIPSRAANSVQTLRTCEALAARGVDVTLVAKCGDRASSDEEIWCRYGLTTRFELRRVCFGSRRGLVPFLRAVSRTLAERSPDVVFGRYVYALLWAAACGHRVAYEVHALPEVWWKRTAESLLFASARLVRVVAISHALGDAYRARHPRLRERISVVADAAIDPGPPQHVPFASEPYRVGYSGGFYRGRGVERVVDLARRMPDLEFHLLGGSALDLEALVGEAPANVTCHGYVAPQAVAGWLASMDVLLAPYGARVAVFGGGGDISKWMSPLKIFEYMASGRPFVVTDLPVLREVLTDGRNCTLARSDDPAEWESHVRALAERPDHARALGERARRDFLAGHTWAARAQRIEAALAP
jgi:glycosyltransferase involved in cell wall biosynthesis